MENNPNQIPTPSITPPQDPYYSPAPQQQPQPFTADPMQPQQVQPAVSPFTPPQPQQVAYSPVPAAAPIPAPVPVGPAPSPFGAPAAPIGSSPGGSYSPKKGPGKGLIFGLVGGLLGLILLIGGGFLLVSMLFVVSKSDYETAYSSASDMRSSYVKLRSTYLSSSSTETEIKNEVDTFKKSLDAFNEDYEKLSELKAVKVDSDVSVKFKSLSDKKVKFDNARAVELEAYEKVMPALIRFTSSTSTSSSAKITQWRSDMEGITGLKYDTNKNFVNSLVVELKALEAAAVRVETSRSDYRMYDSGALPAFYDSYDKVTTSMTDWGSNIDKLNEDGDLSDEINDLGEIITKKMNGK